MPNSNIYHIEVLGKALDVLDAFVQAKKPELSLQEISRLTKLNKNTVFRILYTLAERGYIHKENREYELGPKLMDLGSAKVRHRNLLEVAGPYLSTLRDRFGETVNLGVLEGGSIRYVDVLESPNRFRLAERVGGSDYLHCTALGKSYLAFLPFEEVRLLMKQYGMPRRTEKTLTTVSALKAELENVRQLGFALDREEGMTGAFCIGAPILDSNETPIAAVSVSGPIMRFNESNVPAVSEALRDAVVGIRAKMGFQGA